MKMKTLKPMIPILLAVLFIAQSCSGEDTPPAVQFNFVTTAPSSSDHNRPFSYTFEATSDDNSPITYEVTKPDWMDYNEATLTLSGTPGWELLNQAFSISIVASNGEKSIRQTQSVLVALGEIVCESDFGDPAASPYILPFNIGETYKVNQTYCPPNPAWGHHNWFAYDFETPTGTDILAMRAGQVIATDNSQSDTPDCSNGSNFVFILHDDGTVAQYAHFKMNSVIVNVGDRVEQGQSLALSGNSGCSSGPHLHVNLYKQRGPYDRQYTLPFNFSNAEGDLNSANGLIQNGLYTAK